jgi:hypothetical protein
MGSVVKMWKTNNMGKVWKHCENNSVEKCGKEYCEKV